MTREQMNRLAVMLREITAELKAAPAAAQQTAKKYIAELGPAAAIVGPEPFALGTLEGKVDAAVARLNAAITVYLEPKRRRA